MDNRRKLRRKEVEHDGKILLTANENQKNRDSRQLAERNGAESRQGGQVDVQTTVENTNVGRELKSKNLTANNQAFVV
jgi:hypothetical protein